MNPGTLNVLLAFYGSFLIISGIASVVFIGAKAKTALISGGLTGVISLILGYYSGQQSVQLAGIFLSFFLFCIFSWRSTKTLFAIFDMLPAKNQGLKAKGIAFLIISLMAVVSMVVGILQLTLCSFNSVK